MSLYRKDRDRYLELLKYQVQLSDQRYWENRKNYFSVMNNLITEKLTAEDFIVSFGVSGKKMEIDLRQIVNLI